MFKCSEFLITVHKHTIYVIPFALSVDKRKQNLFATRYLVVDSEEFLREKISVTSTRRWDHIGTQTARVISRASLPWDAIDAVTRRERSAPGWTRRADYASARAASAEQAGQCQGVPLRVLLFPVIPTEPILLSYEVGGFTSRDARDELSYYTTNIMWHSEFIERVFRCDGLIPACE